MIVRQPRLQTTGRWITLLAFCALTLGLLFLQIYHFRHRDLRLDEILTAHAGLALSPSQITLWRAGDIHPPLWTLLGAAWSSLVGLDAGLLRFQSTLYVALTLALLYRLGASLFRPSVGLAAILIAGTWSVFHFYSHEFRPYAPLAMWTVACQLAFLWWLRRPGFKTALAFVISGIGIIYTHYFGMYAVAALALVFVLFVRWNGPYYLRTFGLFAAIGLAYSPWLLPFVHSFTVTRPRGIEYGVGGSLGALRELLGEFAPQPLALAELLLAASPLLLLARDRQLSATPTRFRRGWGGGRWRKAYPMLFAGLVLALALFANQFVESVTLRNLTLVVPSLALILAFVLDRMPLPVRLVGLALLALPGVTTFTAYERQLPFEDMAVFMAETYTQGAPIIFNTGRGPSTNAGLAYNLYDRLPHAQKQQFIHLSPVTTEIAPDPLPNEVTGSAAADVEVFVRLLGAPEQFWYVHAPGDDARGALFLAALGGDYEAVRSRVWNEEDMLRIGVTEYRRILES